MLNIRKYSDGTFGIPRPDIETENYLNSKYKKFPNELRWFNEKDMSLEQFRDTHIGCPCYIFGKGQSLDQVKNLDLPDNSILIAINEAIHAIESLDFSKTYGTQLDTALRETCRPKRSKLLLSTRCANLYENYSNKFVVNLSLLGLQSSSISGLFAIRMAKLFGCNKISMVAFDGALRQDYTYAKTIGHPVSGDARRFALHYTLLVDALQNIENNWITIDKQGKVSVTVTR